MVLGENSEVPDETVHPVVPVLRVTLEAPDVLDSLDPPEIEDPLVSPVETDNPERTPSEEPLVKPAEMASPVPTDWTDFLDGMEQGENPVRLGELVGLGPPGIGVDPELMDVMGNLAGLAVLERGDLMELLVLLVNLDGMVFLDCLVAVGSLERVDEMEDPVEMVNLDEKERGEPLVKGDCPEPLENPE